MPDYSIEASLHEKGFTYVCGIDEAGRGPLCGPVYAAACILPDGLVIEGLNDSKKLTAKKREKLFDVICSEAIAYCIASASVEEIDELNILEADLLAMRRAIDGLAVKADFALIDGNCSRGFSIATQTVVGGDAKSMSIAAASILAKVTRDRMMVEYDRIYPEYDLASNKGYGTKKHLLALEKYGITKHHRLSYGPVFEASQPKLDI